MTSHESSVAAHNWTGENSGQPYDTPEIREYITALLKRVDEIVSSAPEAPHWDALTPEYQWASRQAKDSSSLEGADVTLLAGEAEQTVWEGYAPEGSPFAIRQSHREPDRAARHRFDTLIAQAKEPGRRVSLTHTLRREVVIADVAAEQRITATCRVHEGKFQVVTANLALIRPLADGQDASTFFQTVGVHLPGPSNAAFYPQDYIARANGLISYRDTEARDRAAAILPEDAVFPAGQSLGVRQIEAFLK